MGHSHFCFYCGRALSRQTTTQDHVRPRSKGGSDSKNNKVDCCRPCNEEKGCLTLEEFRAVFAFREGIPVEKYRFWGEMEKGGQVHPSSELAKPNKRQKYEQKRKQRRQNKQKQPQQPQQNGPESELEIVMQVE